MKDQLRDYLSRPKRYDNIDGTGEMSMGLMILGFALLGHLQANLPQDSMWRHGLLASLAFMYAVLLPVLAICYWGPKAIKKRITWPRTGYVACGLGGSEGGTKRSFWTTIAAVAVLSAVIGAVVPLVMLVARHHQSVMSLSRAGYLVFWVSVYGFWVGRMGGNHSWKWLVLLFMALGLLAIVLLVPGGIIELSRPTMLFVGLTWFGSGAATLFLYLRRTHPPTLEVP